MNSFKIALVVSCCGGMLQAAIPEVMSVTMAQRAGSRKVDITYDLKNADAVVTLDIQTNSQDGVWASIGGVALGEPTGDVGGKVSVGNGKSIVWDARSWPDQVIEGPNVRAVVTAWPIDSPADYMTVDIESGAVRFYASTETLPGGFNHRDYKTRKLLMRKIPARGKVWRMGSPQRENGRWQIYGGWNLVNEGHETRHLVTLTNDYYMGVYECTIWQYEKLGCPSDGEHLVDPKADRDLCPVGCLWGGRLHGESGPNAALRTKTGIASFDLPTDAQWEFACRAGSGSALYTGVEIVANAENAASLDARVEAIAWYDANSGGYAHEVGTRKPNAFGLYDMIGNVNEECRDFFSSADAYIGSFGEGYRIGDVVVDPKGCLTNQGSEDMLYVYRGGGFDSKLCYCRSAYRSGRNAWSGGQPVSCGVRMSCLANDVVK